MDAQGDYESAPGRSGGRRAATKLYPGGKFEGAACETVSGCPCDPCKWSWPPTPQGGQWAASFLWRQGRVKSSLAAIVFCQKYLEAAVAFDIFQSNPTFESNFCEEDWGTTNQLVALQTIAVVLNRHLGALQLPRVREGIAGTFLLCMQVCSEAFQSTFYA